MIAGAVATNPPPPRTPAQKYTFSRPTDVGWDPQGNIFISDGYGNNRVVKYDKNGRFLAQAGSETVQGSHLLIAVGRRPNMHDLNLEAAGIRYGDQGIVVDRTLRTSNKRIYAIGGITDGPKSDNAGPYHATLVIRHALLQLPVRANHDSVARVAFTDPEFAHVGLQEDEARARHRVIRVLRWPFRANERALAERLRVSRITIRRALARLAEKDLVRSSERSGWFTVPVSHGSTAMISFTDQGRLRGFAVTSRVLRCVTREATLEEAEELGIAPGSQVCDLARIRFFDGLPIATTEAIVPAALASGLDRYDFSTASLYDVLRTEYQVFPSRGKFVIQAGAAAPPVSDRLEVSPGDPVLIYSQTGYERGGRAFEVAKTVYRADRYLFRGTLVTDSEGTAPVVTETR